MDQDGAGLTLLHVEATLFDFAFDGWIMANEEHHVSLSALSFMDIAQGNLGCGLMAVATMEALTCVSS